jgi:hypothetical protein
MLSSDFVTAPLLMFTLSSNLCYSTRSVSTQRTDYSQYTGLRTLAATTPPPSRPTNERDSQFHKKFRVRRIATPPTPSISLVRRRRCQKYLRKKAGLKRPFANAELLR